MRKAFTYLAAVLLVGGACLQEFGCKRPSASESGKQVQSVRPPSVLATAGGGFFHKIPTLSGAIQERRRAFNEVVFDPIVSSTPSAPVPPPKPARVARLADHSRIEGAGAVVLFLSYDPKDDSHQKFIVRLATGKTFLIAHDTTISPRITDLKLGDQVAFCGEYTSGLNGDEICYTHRNLDGRHTDGWLKHNGITYQ